MNNSPSHDYVVFFCQIPFLHLSQKFRVRISSYFPFVDREPTVQDLTSIFGLGSNSEVSGQLVKGCSLFLQHDFKSSLPGVH